MSPFALLTVNSAGTTIMVLPFVNETIGQIPSGMFCAPFPLALSSVVAISVRFFNASLDELKSTI